jgi:hypothetical protein
MNRIKLLLSWFALVPVVHESSDIVFVYKILFGFYFECRLYTNIIILYSKFIYINGPFFLNDNNCNIHIG